MTIFQKTAANYSTSDLAVPSDGLAAGILKILAGQTKHLQKPQEPVMGIEPMTPVLPRLCATAAPHGQAFWVGSEGFEPPKSETADLQSAPFGHFGNCPG